MTARPLTIDPLLLMWLLVRISELTDERDAARQNVEAEQDPHAATRLRLPRQAARPA